MLGGPKDRAGAAMFGAVVAAAFYVQGRCESWREVQGCWRMFEFEEGEEGGLRCGALYCGTVRAVLPVCQAKMGCLERV